MLYIFELRLNNKIFEIYNKHVLFFILKEKKSKVLNDRSLEHVSVERLTNLTNEVHAIFVT